MEQILNYLDMSEEQRALALNSLSSIGFYPAHGKMETMRRIMDQSIVGERPQFYFAFRDSELIGYMFLIGDAQRFRSFPWIEINNLDELPMNLTEQLMKIAIDTYRGAGDIGQAIYHETLLGDYRNEIGHRRESDCR
ncbi:MAG: hypothetical protein ACOX67_10070 [Oscillospiraceae bacterium]